MAMNPGFFVRFPMLQTNLLPLWNSGKGTSR